MEQNKLPKNIRQIGEKEDWIRVYIEDYVHTYIQRLRDLEDGGISGGVLLGRKQRINGVMHLFIRGAVVAEDPFWRNPAQTPGQMRAESSVYFPELEICGFFVSSRQNRNSEVDLVRIFETHFSSEYQVLFNVRDQDEEVFSFSGHGLIKLAGYYIYYEKNEEMQSYIIRQESLRVMSRSGRKAGGENIYEESSVYEMENPERNTERARTMGRGGNEEGTRSEEKGENAEKARKGGKNGKAGKYIVENKKKKSVLERKGGFQMGAGMDDGKQNSPGEKGAEGEKRSSEKKKIKKGDMIVRFVSIAGIFILAFLLFSDQVKFSKIEDTVESGSGLLSSILSESEAVLAGADSDHISSVTGEDDEGNSLTGESNLSGENTDSSDDGSDSSIEGSAGQEISGESGSGENGSDDSGTGIVGADSSVTGSDGTDNSVAGSDGTGSSEAAGSVTGSDGTNDSAAGDSGAAGSDGTTGSATAGSNEDNGTNSDQIAQSDSGTTAEASASYVFPMSYLVKKGDSLYAISEKYYGDAGMVDAICLENNITDPSSLNYGTIITLPAR